jgi:hypothetical protein
MRRYKDLLYDTEADDSNENDPVGDEGLHWADGNRKKQTHK